MSLIAILSARAPEAEEEHAGAVATGLRAMLAFGSGTLLEHQARQAIDAGARTLLIHVDAVSPELARVADRLGGHDGASVTFIREMPAFAGRMDRDDRILCIGDGMLVPQHALAALAAGAAPRLLVTPRLAATQAFERIDAQDVWAGAMLLTGALLLDTIDLLGDWELMPTLLRVGVQQGAGRLVVSPDQVMEGHLVQVMGGATATLALETLPVEARAREQPPRGLAHRLFAPLGSKIARLVIRRQIDPPRLVPLSLALAAGGVGLAAYGWSSVALILVLAGLAIHAVAGQAGALMLHPPLSRWSAYSLGAASLCVIGLIAGAAGSGEPFTLVTMLLVLGLLLIVNLTAGPTTPPDTEQSAMDPLPMWARLDMPSALVLLLLGASFGLVPLAMGLIGVFALAEIAFDRTVQRRPG